MQTLNLVRGRRGYPFQALRAAFGWPWKVKIVAIRPAERGGGAVFWVHARNASLRGPSDIAGARSLLCALRPRSAAPEISEFAIVALDSKTAVDAWIASGGRDSSRAEVIGDLEI